jgi:hypothetical protein
MDAISFDEANHLSYEPNHIDRYILHINHLLGTGIWEFHVDSDPPLNLLKLEYNKQKLIDIMEKYRKEGWSVNYYAGEFKFWKREEGYEATK